MSMPWARARATCRAAAIVTLLVTAAVLPSTAETTVATARVTRLPASV